MQIAIRKAISADAEEISRLSGQLGYSFSSEDTGRQLIAIGNSVNDVAYVAIAENRVVGWIHAFYTLRLESASFCEIGGLVTDEQYRGKGIGKMLVAQAKKWCTEKGCTRLKVRSNAKRKEAHQFYTSVGFAEIKQQKVFEIAL